MTPALPDAFLTIPLAHRCFHDAKRGRPENTLAAAQAAIDAGYGIEIDIQQSSDGVAMVFHDEVLGRLTGREGAVRAHSEASLSGITVLGTNERIPSLADFLDLVGGKVPVLIEIKDQTGQLGPTDGVLEAAVCKALSSYAGDVAVMSFNPHSVFAVSELEPHIPRGLTTEAFSGLSWNPLSKARREELRAIPDYARVGASFISHDVNDLASPVVADLKSNGAHVLCWTVRSEGQEATARRVADNITFEGYAAAHPIA